MEDTDVELGDVDIIQSTVQSLLDCVENEKNHTNKLQASIYRVPRVFRDLSPCSFSPRVVSIGPLHREDKKLQEFEGYKASYAHSLLHRLDSTTEKTLQACVQKVCDSIEKVRECYAEVVTYSDAELAKIMVLDGCFILEFIYNFSKDGFVGNRLFEEPVLYELFLLENQIPFFVLDDIFQCTILKLGSKASLSSFVIPVIRYIHIFMEDDLEIDDIGTNTIPHHILGLLYQCYRPTYDISKDYSSFSIHSATELVMAGVNFKPNRNAKWSMAMEVESHRFPWLFWFWGKPTLRMPVLLVHDYSEFLIRNLMAYEQSTLGCSFVASYLVAMDMLINTQKDIATLVKSKVFVNYFGSDDEAAQMINYICKEVSVANFHYNQQWKILDSHCNSYWPKNVAWLRRTYFNSPWNIIALLAGIILFILTVVQTISRPHNLIIAFILWNPIVIYSTFSCVLLNKQFGTKLLVSYGRFCIACFMSICNISW